MTSIHPSRLAGWSLMALALAATASSPLVRAQSHTDAAENLDTFVVSATRTASDPATVPSSVSLLSLETLNDSQVFDLRSALAVVPGVTVVNSGGAGAQSTVYIRGGSNAQTLVVVDGIRMSTRQTDFYSRSVTGNSSLAGLDRVEILRGPQGTLYGSSAMGGVILMDTTHGAGAFSGALAGEVGSFDSYSANVAVQGAAKSLGYSASLGHSSTANDRPKNDNEVTSFSTRLEGKPTDTLLFGFTLRTQEGKYEEPGSTAYASPGNVDSDSYLATTYGELALADFRSRLTLGWQQLSYLFVDTSGSPWASNSYNRSTRRVLDWQNTWTPTPGLVLVGGFNAERSRFVTPELGHGLTDASNGTYLSADCRLNKQLALIAGARYDHFDTAGSATTGRVGAAYRIDASKTKLRATLGSGFAAPSMTERYGDTTWYVANANLKAEKSNGWDLGVDQEIGKLATVGITYFQSHYRDMIVANSVGNWVYQWQNVNRAQTRGLEFETSIKLAEGLKTHLSYTYLDVYDHSAHSRVAYKPRQSGDAEISWQPTKALILGTGLHVTADRMKSASAAIEDYTSVRLFGSYDLTKGLRLRARVENLLDERYDEIAGYPALPIAVYGGVEWRF